MTIVEQAILFPCSEQLLPAIVALPSAVVAAKQRPAFGAAEQLQSAPGKKADSDSSAGNGTRGRRAACGVLIIVGGPQYRVGSHRQFLLLSRRLAGEGYPAMRFDYRGMGDASGSMCSFDEVSIDIAAAIDAFQIACPAVRQVVLWGLCDAASAALLYVQATADARIAGLALLNPWVRSETSLAQTHIKHYYGQRLLQGEFWRKLLSGRLEIRKSLRSLLNTALLARGARASSAKGKLAQTPSFQQRMALGWQDFAGGLLLILSGQDYTAKEFLEFAGAQPAWAGLIAAAKVHRVDLADADHTFSSKAQRAQVEDATLAWLDGLAGVQS